MWGYLWVSLPRSPGHRKLVLLDLRWLSDWNIIHWLVCSCEYVGVTECSHLISVLSSCDCGLDTVSSQLRERERGIVFSSLTHWTEHTICSWQIHPETRLCWWTLDENLRHCKILFFLVSTASASRCRVFKQELWQSGASGPVDTAVRHADSPLSCLWWSCLKHASQPTWLI